MANINYRGNGAWGNGLGRSLTSPEVDTNFYQLNTNSQNRMPNGSGELGTFFWSGGDPINVLNGGVGTYFNVNARAVAATVLFTSNNIPVTAGSPISVSIDALISNYAGTPLLADVQYFDNNGTLVQDGADHNWAGLNGANFNTLSFTETVPSGATQAAIRLVATNATWTFIRWRRVKVSQTESFSTAYNNEASLYYIASQDWTWVNRQMFGGVVSVSLAAGTVSGVSVGKNGVNPNATFKKVDAPADQKIWDIQTTDTQLVFRTANDAYSSATNWLTVTRSGATVNSINTLVRPTFNGNTAWDAGNFNPALYAALSGATFSGAVSLSYASPALTLNAPVSGQQRSININTNGSGRWQFGATSGAESGSNAGSDFFIARYSDAGAFIDSPFLISRSSGVTTFGGNVQATGTAVDRSISISANAGQIRALNFQSAGVNRWQVSTGNGAESGSNVGSNFLIARYADNGTFIENVASFNRSTGNGTFNRPFTVDTTAAAVDSIISLNGPAAKNRIVYFQTGASNRWAMFTDAVPESGSNVGSNFGLQRYSDAGAAIDTPVSIARSTGVVALSQRPVFNGKTPWDTGNVSPLIGAAGGGDTSDLAVNVYQRRLTGNYTAGPNGIIMVNSQVRFQIQNISSTMEVLARITLVDTTNGGVVGLGADAIMTIGAWNSNAAGGAALFPILATGGLTPGRVYQVNLEVYKNAPQGPVYPLNMTLQWFGY
jgi:hypothetical protein